MALETGTFIELILADRCYLSQFKQIIKLICYPAGREHYKCMPAPRLRQSSGLSDGHEEELQHP